MFQLIVTVISIALIAALAIASIFYGGSAFSGSSAKTGEATLVNGGQQISGAAALYRTDKSGVSATALTDLTGATPPYLQAAPTPPTGVTGSWAIGGVGNGFAIIQMTTGAATTATVTANEICKRVEADNGAATNDQAAVTAAADVTLAAGIPFDCVPTGSGIYFAYKL